MCRIMSHPFPYVIPPWFWCCRCWITCVLLLHTITFLACFSSISVVHQSSYHDICIAIAMHDVFHLFCSSFSVRSIPHSLPTPFKWSSCMLHLFSYELIEFCIHRRSTEPWWCFHCCSKTLIRVCLISSIQYVLATHPQICEQFTSLCFS